MKTYWEVRAKNLINTRFVCAECGYNSLSRSLDRGTIRMDCVFCGWDCFIDIEGWWHQKTSHEMAQELDEERMYEEMRQEAGLGDHPPHCNCAYCLEDQYGPMI